MKYILMVKKQYPSNDFKLYIETDPGEVIAEFIIGRQHLNNIRYAIDSFHSRPRNET